MISTGSYAGRRNFSVLTLLTLVTPLISQQAFTQGVVRCNQFFEQEQEIVTPLNQYSNIEAKNEIQQNIVTLLQNKKLIAITPTALKLVFNHELRIYEQTLLDVLKSVEQQNSLQETLLSLYRSQHFPEELIQPRLSSANSLTARNILPVLGDLTLAESQRLFLGKPEDFEAISKGNRRKIAPDSLVGKYLRESKAKIGFRSFSETRPGRDPWTGQPFEAQTGVERLVILVDEKTLPIWKKYFSNTQAFSVIGHGNIVFRGKVLIQTQAMQESDLRMPSIGTPLPFVLFKTTEGQRFAKYVYAFQNAINFNAPGLNGWGWDNTARAPWNQIPGLNGKPYMDKKGAFNCCVHWNGNIPVGDKLVKKIVLPGPNGNPVVAKINPPDYSDPALEHVSEVWTYPLHEPISSLLGLAENNGRGNFASAGWVIESLLVAAPIERVPFVFQFVDDAKDKYEKKSPLYYEGPM